MLSPKLFLSTEALHCITPCCTHCPMDLPFNSLFTKLNETDTRKWPPTLPSQYWDTPRILFLFSSASHLLGYSRHGHEFRKWLVCCWICASAVAAFASAVTVKFQLELVGKQFPGNGEEISAETIPEKFCSLPPSFCLQFCIKPFVGGVEWGVDSSSHLCQVPSSRNQALLTTQKWVKERGGGKPDRFKPNHVPLAEASSEHCPFYRMQRAFCLSACKHGSIWRGS